MLLAKIPDPCPSVVCDPSIVGFVAVAQHIPFAVTAAPPSLVISPPLVMELIVRFIPGLVVRVGIVGSLTQLPRMTIPVTKKIIRIRADRVLITDIGFNAEKYNRNITI
jgi:hypothetical protein